MAAVTQAMSAPCDNSSTDNVAQTESSVEKPCTEAVVEASSTPAVVEEPSQGDAKSVDIDALDDSQLSSQIFLVLKGLDLATMSLKQLRAALETKLGLEAGALDGHAERIKGFATIEIARLQAGEEEEEAAEDKVKEAVTPPRKTDRKRKFNQAKVKYVAALAAKKQRKEEDQMKKGRPSITTSEFQRLAKPISVQIGDTKVEVPPKSFNTGTSGFFMLKILPVKIGDQVRDVQCLIQCAVVGSKADAAPGSEVQEAAVQEAAVQEAEVREAEVQ